MDSLSRFLIFSETFRPKRGVFPISTGVFRSHLPAVLAHAGRREKKGKECRGRVAFGSQGVRIIRCSFVIGRKTRSSCKIIFPTFRSTLPPFLTGSAWQRAVPESPNFAPRSSAFRCACAAYSSRARVSCFSFFAFTSSPVCDKRLWDSSFGVKAFVNVLHGALSSPIMRMKSMNCKVKVKAKIENSLCARYT